MRRHPSLVNGIVYVSRHLNDREAVVIFDRGVHLFGQASYVPLNLAPGIVEAIVALGLTFPCRWARPLLSSIAASQWAPTHGDSTGWARSPSCHEKFTAFEDLAWAATAVKFGIGNSDVLEKLGDVTR